MAMIANWVWLANLNVLIDEVQEMAGARLDEGLLRILHDDIDESDTDASPPRWASCVFDGARPVGVWLGIDQGTDVLQVRLELPDNLSVRADTILYLMQRYRLIP